MNKIETNLLWGSNLWFFGEGLFGPLFAVFSQRIGGNILDITWAWGLYLVIAGVLTIIVGKYSDGTRRKEKLMMFGYVLNTIFTFGYLLVRSPWHLFVVQTGLGLAVAFTFPTWEALYATHQGNKKAGYIWGLASGEYRILAGIAVVLGGFIVKYFSFQTLFLLMGCVQIIATIYQARIFSLLKKR